MHDPGVPAEMSDESHPGAEPERAARRGVAQRPEQRNETDEGERPDAEPDPGEEVEDARQRRQQQASHEAPSCNMTSHGGAAQPDQQPALPHRAAAPAFGRYDEAGVAGDARRPRPLPAP